MFKMNLKTLAAIVITALFSLVAAPAAQAQDESGTVTLLADAPTCSNGVSVCEQVQIHEEAFHSLDALKLKMKEILAAQDCRAGEQLMVELEMDHKDLYQRVLSLHDGHHFSLTYGIFRNFLRTCHTMPAPFDPSGLESRIEELEQAERDRKPPPDAAEVARKAAELIPPPPEPLDRYPRLALTATGEVTSLAPATGVGMAGFLPTGHKAFILVHGAYVVTPDEAWHTGKPVSPFKWQRSGEAGQGFLFDLAHLSPLGADKRHWWLKWGVASSMLRVTNNTQFDVRGLYGQVGILTATSRDLSEFSRPANTEMVRGRRWGPNNRWFAAVDVSGFFGIAQSSPDKGETVANPINVEGPITGPYLNVLNFAGGLRVTVYGSVPSGKKPAR